MNRLPLQATQEHLCDYSRVALIEDNPMKKQVKFIFYSETISNGLAGGSYKGLSLNEEPKSELKLVINDDPVFEEKKSSIH